MADLCKYGHIQTQIFRNASLTPQQKYDYPIMTVMYKLHSGSHLIGHS